MKRETCNIDGDKESVECFDGDLPRLVLVQLVVYLVRLLRAPLEVLREARHPLVAGHFSVTFSVQNKVTSRR